MSVNKIVNIDFKNYKPQRAGIIPFVIYENDIYYCLGVDHKHQELTDFGGSVNYKHDVTGISGALREFKEETLKVFRKVSQRELDNSYIVYDDKMMIIIHKMDCNMRTIITNFRKKVNELKHPEVSDIVWLSEGQLKKIVTTEDPIEPTLFYPPGLSPSYFMYNRVKEVLKAYFI
jgi:hypothetical protein